MFTGNDGRTEVHRHAAHKRTEQIKMVLGSL
jgi:hypothetical protein